ncbi:hypothetical protein FNV43_RR11156 [Rhamnella rubrinervis]|uniref:Uncharacterized protein n=1 Tax=Rhamnella rubrinervis TaxID=2594499 RepID=A0A8K0H5T6_9ROSA|nr:hypothetical protein FNV43_RR11156 [Rhamnella rubrinervis]
MRKKRKGSDTDPCQNLADFLSSTHNARSSVITSHYSLEDYTRLKKRCKEDANDESGVSYKSRLAGIATAPPWDFGFSYTWKRSQEEDRVYRCRHANGSKFDWFGWKSGLCCTEVLLGKYSEKVDIWSAGVLLHVLLVGIWQLISKPARDLIGRMLTRDVSARITADEVLRHPWILFYTERTLKTIPINEGSSPLSSSDSCESEDQDDTGLIDALATAVSHVRISEPKRSRVCGPTGPIEQQCSSNMKANNLCKAF